MKIVIDKKSGFCFGVINAIRMAEEALTKEDKLYCLGDIVHNNMEVDRLRKAGLETITHDQYFQLSNCKVLIRAHGEPPRVYDHARENNIELIDATCPVVLQLQKRIRKSYDEIKPKGGLIVIYGKKGHAEVNGLNGQINGDALIIESLDDLDTLNFEQPIRLFSQTTKSIEGFEQVASKIMEQTSNPLQVKINDTICRQVANRVPQVREFAKQFEVVIFVSGRKSSNGKLLYEVCKKQNPNTYMVSEPEELDRHWFDNIESVGICGATSTPHWLMESIAAEIEHISNMK
ncbi:MAG: 4-hydroxy-3-methylbut-2-enyl diphosphate reductase [Bacteroidota bacterium]|nr:4-hydroxy-3-methylbut-2-enyl diphosphate reductase [Bacteroidota bacterium]MDP4205396.1 4-hydroxy-3-methylbut-2-enyl diphosphate reductase [Bacteroidota bacterium]